MWPKEFGFMSSRNFRQARSAGRKLKNNKSIDSFFSANKSDFSDLISNIRQIEKAVGKINYNVTTSAKNHLVGKRSIYTSFLKRLNLPSHK